MRPNGRLARTILVAAAAGLLVGLMVGMALTVPWLPMKLGQQPLESVGSAGATVGLLLAIFVKRWRKTGAIITALSIVLATLVIIRSSQRSLYVVAEKDLPVAELRAPYAVVGALKQGQKARIIRCNDTKSLIEPIVALPDGSQGIPSPGYRIEAVSTGRLSRPQFLECGDY